MKKIEHLGIAVSNLEAAGETFRKLLGKASYKEEKVEREGVTTLFFQLGSNKIELLEASSQESTIAKFIARRGEGMHHVAFDVDDIQAEMARLQDEGFELLHSQPLAGADNKLICFIHPKCTHGVLVELCQEIHS
ncbi:MAG: methylmalonyl-CoA epimerase [Flavobacteriales bacterium]|nr:methylmalonyl-CoA epimerase [Flavobacteriales bacterium]